MKSLLLILILTASVPTQAKQWVLTPHGRRTRIQGMRAMAEGRHLRLRHSVESIDIHQVESDEAIPVAPEGYEIAEVKKVEKFSNDPLYAQQWNMDKVMAPRGWANAGQNNHPIVAVIDTGIDASHPDLAGRVIGGGNFVDYGGNAVLPAGSWADDNAHGTFCASLIGATRDNGIGLAGMDGSVRLLAVKVLDAQGYGSDFGVAQGMVWAVDNGAKILSISLGTASYSAALAAAVSYAQSHGVLVVAASGNSGQQDLIYPAALDGVVSVGASNKDDQRAWYSTYNGMLSLVAPGGDSAAEITGAVPGGYSHGVGTSFACPQVAGAAALYMSTHPRSSVGEVFAALTGTADPVDMAPGKSVTTGWGRLNVARLMGQDVEPNVFEAMKVSGTVAAQRGTVNVLVGAGEPAAPNRYNPDPSHIDKVWAVVTQSGSEIARTQLNSLGGNDWTAQVTMPAWAGVGSRILALGYQASDSTGHVSPLVDGGSVVQAAGSIMPSFTHNPPASTQAGSVLDLSLTQFPARPAFSSWSIHFRNTDGLWQQGSGLSDGAGHISFEVPASSVKADSLDYYFSALDGGGSPISVRNPADPYKVAVVTSGEPMKLKYLANPAPELCVRVMASADGVADVDFYSLSGEKVGNIHENVRAGENRLCLGRVVASGTYFGVTRLDGKNLSNSLKLAIKR